VREFESVKQSLGDPESDSRLRYNYAYSLAQLGRFEEATAVLDLDGEPGWPDKMRAKARILLDHLRLGGVGDLHVLN